MRLIVDEMPESCCECLFSKRGAHIEDGEYRCVCTLQKKEKTLYEFEIMDGCPLIPLRIAKNL